MTFVPTIPNMQLLIIPIVAAVPAAPKIKIVRAKAVKPVRHIAKQFNLFIGK